MPPSSHRWRIHASVLGVVRPRPRRPRPRCPRPKPTSPPLSRLSSARCSSLSPLLPPLLARPSPCLSLAPGGRPLLSQPLLLRLQPSCRELLPSVAPQAVFLLPPASAPTPAGGCLTRTSSPGLLGPPTLLGRASFPRCLLHSMAGSPRLLLRLPTILTKFSSTLDTNNNRVLFVEQPCSDVLLG